ncbi:MAG: hypothetical protein R3244_11355 [Thermoanaerobaculia bacterium]|nr:hypothetical protein [Thermoanaerobaculia bacterium]
MIRKILIAVVAIAIVAAVGLFGYWKALEQGLVRYNEYDIRSEGMLEEGDLAPDLELASVDGGEPRRLSEFWAERPLVLVFGSYT